MKITVKRLNGAKFEIQSKPEDTVDFVKKEIENKLGRDVYPAVQQMLIFNGTILEDGTTLDENKVMDNSSIVIMSTKNKSSPGESSTSNTTTTTKAPQTSHQGPASSPISSAPQASLASLTPPAPASAIAPVLTSASASIVSAVSDGYGQAASNITTRNILDDSGIPERVEAPPVPHSPNSGQADDFRLINEPLQRGDGDQMRQIAADVLQIMAVTPEELDAIAQRIQNAELNTGLAGSLDFLRNNLQFLVLSEMVRNTPQILQPMLQVLGELNPNLLTLIQQRPAELSNLIDEPLQLGDGAPLRQIAPETSQWVEVTPEDRDAIQRLVAMGYSREMVLLAFFLCDKNEEQAARYLLDLMAELQE